jgi:mobilome CxxCx(11)CxxC protein
MSDIHVNRFHELLGEQNVRDSQDEKYNINDKELRMGMKYGLRMFKVKCDGCGEVPKSLETTNCNICGNF